MGEIADFVTIYIQESDILEDEAKKISNSLKENIQNVIRPGAPAGYDTGHLHDTIMSEYDADDTVAIITAWYSADYGQYWYRWKKGVDFLQSGLEATLELYG